MSLEDYREKFLATQPTTGIDGDQDAMIVSAYISHLEDEANGRYDKIRCLAGYLEYMLDKTDDTHIHDAVIEAYDWLKHATIY